MNITGKIREILNEKKITESFKKREFILDYTPDSGFPQIIKFELVNDLCSLIDNFKKGDKVEVEFELRGREWKNPQGELVYFTTLRALKIKKIDEDLSAVDSKDLSDNDDSINDVDIPPLPPEDENGDTPF